MTLTFIFSLNTYADFDFQKYFDCHDEISSLSSDSLDVMKGILSDDGVLATHFGNGDGYFAIFRKNDENLFCAFDEYHEGKVIEYDLLHRDQSAGNLIYDHNNNKIVFHLFSK